MHRFWNRFSGPLINAIAPRRILEIGAEFGWNTRHLLAYCREHGAFLDIIEPIPHELLQNELAAFGPEHFTLHVAKSRPCIPSLESPDVVMLDGDHNWFSVFNELTLLRAKAESAGKAMPIVIAHDCAWPYARRDMYYDPSEFHESQRHAYAYKGMLPGVSELVDEGINEPFANALVEGGGENGVLTAIEDFVEANEGLRLWTLPFYNGLGIIAPEQRLNPPVLETIESFFSRESLVQTCEALELDTMHLRVQLTQAHRLLEQRTEALARARAVLKTRQDRIAELENEVGEKAH